MKPWAAAALLWTALPARGAEVSRPAVIPAVPALAAPGGLDLTPTPPRLETLREILTAEPSGLSPQMFSAYVQSEPDGMAAALTAQIASPQKVRVEAFGAMYGGLRRVSRREDIPFEERAALTMILAKRCASYLSVIAVSPELNAPTRALARRMRERFLDGSVTRGVLYASSLEAKARALSELIKPIHLAVLGRSAPAENEDEKDEPWRIPEPPAPSERTRKPGKRKVAVESLPKLAQSLRERREELGQRLERVELLGREEFSDALLAKELSAFEDYIEKFWPAVESEKRQAQRLGETSIRKTLLQGKPHRISRVPTNKGLVLIPGRGGFLIKARFKSSIADRRVWGVVKSSIESEWRGKFKYAGKIYFLRTEVSIEPLDPDERPGDEFLILKEGHNAASHAGVDGITLTRDFVYLTPAHEFGHVLGLPDEYREVYDFDAMEARHESPMHTLMANTHLKPGVLWPRHLKLAYQLLRRHRLVRPAKKAKP